MTSYLKQLVLISCLLMVSVGIVNWWVDPFAIWHSQCVTGVTCRKTEAGDKLRLTKSFQWRSQQPEVLIVGNSRPELGLDPNSASFHGREVYNLSIRGAGLAEQLTFLTNALQQTSPKAVVMSIDFLDFLTRKDELFQWPSERSYGYFPRMQDGRQTPDYWRNLLRVKSQALFSLDTTVASAKTLMSQSRRVNYVTREGFTQADGFLPIVEFEGIQALFDDKIHSLRDRLQDQDYAIKDSTGNSLAELGLKALWQQLQQQEVELILFISPYHERYLEVLAEQGYYDLFLAWKDDVMQRLHTTDFFEQAKLYDFSGFNEYTTEAVPSERGQFMQWYWEPAHYRATLGDRLITHMMNDASPFRVMPDTYQVRLANERQQMQEKQQKSLAAAP